MRRTKLVIWAFDLAPYLLPLRLIERRGDVPRRNALRKFNLRSAGPQLCPGHRLLPASATPAGSSRSGGVATNEATNPKRVAGKLVQFQIVAATN